MRKHIALLALGLLCLAAGFAGLQANNSAAAASQTVAPYALSVRVEGPAPSVKVYVGSVVTYRVYLYNVLPTTVRNAYLTMPRLALRGIKAPWKLDSKLGGLRLNVPPITAHNSFKLAVTIAIPPPSSGNAGPFPFIMAAGLGQELPMTQGSIFTNVTIK